MTSLQQFLPANTMLPPPDFVNKTAQVATVAAAVDRQTGRFFRIVVYSTILFFILSYPATYRVVNHIYYLISNTIATIWCSVWDYYMDWGLFRSFKKERFMLRD